MIPIVESREQLGEAYKTAVVLNSGHVRLAREIRGLITPKHCVVVSEKPELRDQVALVLEEMPQTFNFRQLYSEFAKEGLASCLFAAIWMEDVEKIPTASSEMLLLMSVIQQQLSQIEVIGNLTLAELLLNDVGGLHDSQICLRHAAEDYVELRRDSDFGTQFLTLVEGTWSNPEQLQGIKIIDPNILEMMQSKNAKMRKLLTDPSFYYSYARQVFLDLKGAINKMSEVLKDRTIGARLDAVENGVHQILETEMER